MTLTLDEMQPFLGAPTGAVLASAPFNGSPVRKTTEYDLIDPAIYYDLSDGRAVIVSDEYDTVGVIVLSTDHFGVAAGEQAEVSQATSRDDILNRFGNPSGSGDPDHHPIIGAGGAWDEFVRDDYIIRFEYNLDFTCTTRIILIAP